MKVVVIGATGNVGTATVRALAAEPAVSEVVGVARRLPTRPIETTFADVADGGLRKVRWSACDIGDDDPDAIGEVIAGADVVVHLAWMIQPSREEDVLRRTNLDGTQRLLDAIVRQGVPALVYASSVGTYAPGPKDRRSDESWPSTGIPTSQYSRHKAEVERMLDRFEERHPGVRVVRMRTSLVFQRDAASEVHRLFLGRILPWHLPRWLRFVPGNRRLAFQATHADDIADAYVRAVVRDVSGPFNIAAEPVLSSEVIASAVHGRVIPTPVAVLRALTRATYALRIQPSEVGWIDLATQTPVMDTGRAHRELDWTASRSSTDSLCELLDGIGDGAGTGTAPLTPRRAPRQRHRRHRPSLAG